MLRIQRSENGVTVLTVSGRIALRDLTQLQEVVACEPERRLALDLRELKLIDSDGIQFLIRCEARGIRVENCPPYIREWMSKEKRQGRSGGG
jgi:anti-anti-sigma regulatory factor